MRGLMALDVTCRRNWNQMVKNTNRLNDLYCSNDPCYTRRVWDLTNLMGLTCFSFNDLADYMNGADLKK